MEKNVLFYGSKDSITRFKLSLNRAIDSIYLKKIPVGVFVEIYKLMQKLILKFKAPRIIKITLKKKNKTE